MGQVLSLLTFPLNSFKHLTTSRSIHKHLKLFDHFQWLKSYSSLPNSPKFWCPARACQSSYLNPWNQWCASKRTPEKTINHPGTWDFFTQLNQPIKIPPLIEAAGVDDSSGCWLVATTSWLGSLEWLQMQAGAVVETLNRSSTVWRSKTAPFNGCRKGFTVI